MSWRHVVLDHSLDEHPEGLLHVLQEVLEVLLGMGGILATVKVVFPEPAVGSCPLFPHLLTETCLDS